MRIRQRLRRLGRWVLAGFMGFAGSAHFMNTQDFLAQVPPILPFPEFVVQASGLVEIVFALALLVLRRQRPLVGLLLAAFFVFVFPGNISQFVTHSDAFGLDTDRARAIRLLFQPVLVLWALWCTDAWRERHAVIAALRRGQSRR